MNSGNKNNHILKQNMPDTCKLKWINLGNKFKVYSMLYIYLKISDICHSTENKIWSWTQRKVFTF